MGTLLMRGLVVVLGLALTAGAVVAQPEQPAPPGPSCDEQLRAASVLIPHLQESRRSYEHLFSIETARLRAVIEQIRRERDAAQAELAKLKPKAETPPAPSTPAAPATPPAPKEAAP